MNAASHGMPSPAALAALRAWYEGLGARQVVSRYLGGQRATSTSSRRVLGQIRRQVAAFAAARHRPDLAQPLHVASAERTEHAKALAHSLEVLPTLAPPQPLVTDPLEQWLDVRLTKPLRAHGIKTFADLTVRVPRRKRWWAAITGLGAAGAREIEGFFAQHPELTIRARALVDQARTEVVPLELLELPSHLDGSAGAFRASARTSTLRATNDLQAVQAWLELQESTATRRAYRKEAERLLLWATIERGRPLSSLTTEDAVAYRGFLRHPTPRSRWVGPTMPRASVEWRPFNGSLSPQSVAYAISVLSALYRWLIEQRYVLANPFAGVKVRNGKRSGALDAKKSFTPGEWSLLVVISGSLEHRHGWSREAADRLRFMLKFCYATGLRASEFVNAVLGDVYIDRDGAWWLELIGKGDKKSRVSLPPLAVASLESYLASRGLPVLKAKWDPRTAVVGRLLQDGERISAGRLWSILRRFFVVAAGVVEQESTEAARKFLAATPHWMRHTHATHALDSGVDLVCVRDNLRHASISTTSTYLHAAESRRAAQLAEAFRAKL
jgi:site-specific recombinase XerD